MGGDAKRGVRAKHAALSVLKLSAAAADRLRPPPAGVVVLIYHRVGARTPMEVDLPAALFESQMAALAASGRAVTLDEALAVVSGPTVPETDPVVVTFDDGTADFVDVALPTLVRHRIPATLYLATDFVERGREFPHQGQPLSWASVGDAASTGMVTVGSHTHTHALLDRLDPVATADELDRSIGLIEHHLGQPVHHFAYPKGLEGSPGAAAMVRERFRSAALAGTRPNPYGRTDPHRLWRSAVQVADGMRWYSHKLEGGMVFEDIVRQSLNRRRYAGSTT